MNMIFRKLMTSFCDVKTVTSFIVYRTRTYMPKPGDKIKNGTLGNEEKPSQRRPSFEKQGTNLVQSKKPELQTADKILRYMQEEEKF